MKKIITYLGFFSLMYLPVFAQESNLRIAENGLEQGNLKKLSSVFYNSVDITFSNTSKTYSKLQAEVIIRKFFSKHEPKAFRVNQKGKSNSNKTLFAIGKLNTSTGEYRVYMFFIPSKGKYLLRELRFEKAN